MKKLLTDRLNELKSGLAELRQPKLTRISQLDKIADMNIRIDEVGKLIQKLNG
jgi:hypothetical protein